MKKKITTGDLMHVYGGFAQEVDYAARLTVRMTDSITEPILARALARTQQRYPYFLRRLSQDGKAPQTIHNCLSMVVFDYEDRIRKMPLPRQCTVYRSKVFIQSDEDAVRQAMTASAAAIRRTEEAAPSLLEKKEQFGRMFAAGEGYISFLVSYVGKWPHPALGDYIREFWTHPPNTFSLMAEIAAVNGTIFISMQQRFKEDTIREAFLRQLEEHQIPCRVLRVMESDVAHIESIWS